jgi:hypothetical protein
MKQCVNGDGEGRVELMGVSVCWECYSRWLTSWAQGTRVFELRGYEPPPEIAAPDRQDSQLQLFGGK